MLFLQTKFVNGNKILYKNYFVLFTHFSFKIVCCINKKELQTLACSFDKLFFTCLPFTKKLCRMYQFIFGLN